jgi:transposase InsO family protein
MIGLTERQTIVAWVAEAEAGGARRARIASLLGISTRTLQRWPRTGGVDRRTTRRAVPPHTLSAEERAEVLAVANSAEFAHLPPSQIVPRLADQGRYLASESTFYRILRATQQLGHRRAERPGQPRARPRACVASAPNQLYSWDITYLPTVVRGVFFYLYLFLDLFSRKIVGWQVHAEENSTYAAALVRDIRDREGIAKGQVILHADNGSPMKGATMLATLQALGVIPSFSRPAVSNDNPFSEALFKTVKYCPLYPDKPFADLGAARAWMETFVHWYNHEHRHSAIRFVTPAERHQGRDVEILAQRKQIYEAAKQRHPQRWSGNTRNWQPITSVSLNPDRTRTAQTTHTTATMPIAA